MRIVYYNNMLVLFLAVCVVRCFGAPMQGAHGDAGRGLDLKASSAGRRSDHSDIYTSATSTLSSVGTSAESDDSCLETSGGECSDTASIVSTLLDLPTLALDCIIGHLRDAHDLHAFRRASRTINDVYSAYCERRQSHLVASGKQTWFEAASLVLHRSSTRAINQKRGSPAQMALTATEEQLTYIVQHAAWTILEWQRIITKAQLLDVQHALELLHAAVPAVMRDEVFSLFTDTGQAVHGVGIHPFLSAGILRSTPWIDRISVFKFYSLLEFAVMISDTFRQDPLEYTRLLLDSGADPRMPGRWSSVIHSAAYRGNLPIVQLLLERAPDLVNALTIYDQTPLMFAAISGNEHLVRYLLERGADVLAQDETFHAMAHFNAATASIAKMLLEAGAFIEAEDVHGCTALTWHIRRERIDVIRVFLERGANIFHRSRSGETPLKAAIATRNVQLVRMLLA